MSTAVSQISMFGVRHEAPVAVGGGERRLIVGECIEVLRSLPPASFHAMVTDPPYSRAGAATNARSASDTLAEEARESDQFWRHWFTDVFRGCARVLRSDGCAWIFCDWRTIGALEESVLRAKSGWVVSQVAVWDRDGTGLGSPLRASYEMIAFVRGPNFRWAGPRNIRNVFRCQWHYSGMKLQGAEKPVDLLRELVKLACHDPATGPHRILDPFVGSGSTLAACEIEGVSGVGIEMSDMRAAVAAKRLGLPVEDASEGRDDGEPA